jgi:hypothetical protein
LGYFVRAFCTAGEAPAIARVLDFATKHGSTVRLDPDVNAPDVADASWDQVGVLYKDGKLPILLEVDRGDSGDSDDSLLKDEIDEFLEFVAEAPDNANRKKVEAHLRATKFVVGAQLATSDIDDDGYNALGNLPGYFVEHNGGLIQADGEGFYEGETLIVAVE